MLRRACDSEHDRGAVRDCRHGRPLVTQGARALRGSAALLDDVDDTAPMMRRARLVCNAVVMHRSRHVLCALALLLTLNACSGNTDASAPDNDTELLPPLVLVSDEPTFTPQQVQYLAAQAWRAAETRTFLEGVQQLVASTPAQLWRIMWCESGRPFGFEYPQPKWDAYNMQGSSASGGGQFLDSTWRTWRGDAGAAYARAAHAPWFVQLAAANRLYAASGTQPWLASAGCWR